MKIENASDWLLLQKMEKSPDLLVSFERDALAEIDQQRLVAGR
jgi:hypothetical protein